MRLTTSGKQVGGLVLQPTRTADFTAAVGKEYPVDMSAMPGVSQLVVSPPPTPKAQDSFAIFDATRQCTYTKMIVVDFTGSVLQSVPNDFASINSYGARIEFTYVDATIGWRVAANDN